jgi:hypothetical protein
LPLFSGRQRARIPDHSRARRRAGQSAPGGDPADVFLAVPDRWGYWGFYARADEPRPYPRALLSRFSARWLLRMRSRPSPPASRRGEHGPVATFKACPPSPRPRPLSPPGRTPARRPPPKCPAGSTPRPGRVLAYPLQAYGMGDVRRSVIGSAGCYRPPVGFRACSTAVTAITSICPYPPPFLALHRATERARACSDRRREGTPKKW